MGVTQLFIDTFKPYHIEGKPLRKVGGANKYRTPKNYSCAIGQYISGKDYNKSMEPLPFRTLLMRLINEARKLDI